MTEGVYILFHFNIVLLTQWDVLHQQTVVGQQRRRRPPGKPGRQMRDDFSICRKK